MISISIERNDQGFATRWRWHTVASRWAAETGQAMASAVRAAAPVGKKDAGNGRLRDSITFKPTVTATTASVEIISRVPYAGYVTRGTPPHVIEPRTARVLHWEQGGNHYYRYRVQHPGNRANPFPETALRGSSAAIQGRMRNVVVSSMEGLT